MQKVLKKQRILGLLAAFVVELLAKNIKKIPLRNVDYRSSTQRMGFRFSNHIRHYWRNKWVFVSKTR
jgi:hypothetical protein